MDYYRSLTFAQSTKSSYKCHLFSLKKYCEDTGQCAVPVATHTLCRYAAYLADKLSFNSIPKYLNIVRILHLEASLPNPLHQNWVLNSVLTGIKRHKGASVQQKLPITPAILLKIRATLHLEQPRDIVFWCVCVVAFYGLLRKSNILPNGRRAFNAEIHLTRNNLYITPLGYYLSVNWSKTNQFRERKVTVPLPYLHNHPLCPAKAITNLLALHPHAPLQSPLFCCPVPDGTAILTQAQFVARLRGTLATLGFPPERYSGHSFRRGGATWAFAAGVPGELIQIMGDWRSDAYKRYLDTFYIRISTFRKTFCSALAKQIIGNGL